MSRCTVSMLSCMYWHACTENVRLTMSLGQTVAGRCVVVEATQPARSRCTTAVSANTTGAVMSSVRRAPRSYRLTDVVDRHQLTLANCLSHCHEDLRQTKDF